LLYAILSQLEKMNRTKSTMKLWFGINLEGRRYLWE
jgi:hypothetical protein